MAIINKLKIQHKRADIAPIHKELTKTFDFNDISKEYLKLSAGATSSNVTVLRKLNRDRPSYFVNENILIAALQTDPIFPHVEIEFPGSPVTPLNKIIAFSKSDHQLETSNIGRHSPSVLENEFPNDSILKKLIKLTSNQKYSKLQI